MAALSSTAAAAALLLLLSAAAVAAAPAEQHPGASCGGGDGQCAAAAATPVAVALAEDGAAGGQGPGASMSLLQQVLQKVVGASGHAARAGAGHGSNASDPVCPPPGLAPVTDFDTAEFIRKSWFAIEQQSVPFQPEPLLCVTATYDLAKHHHFKVPFFYGDIIIVQNWQKQASARLCGSVVDPSTPSALKVAPCFLPAFLAGDYWVVHVEKNGDGTYRWALISSGAPTQSEPDGCTTPAGVWIFSREPTLSAQDLADAKQTLKSLGYTTSLLKPVKQEGCTYEGAPLK